jgi:hypothetical protein
MGWLDKRVLLASLVPLETLDQLDQPGSSGGIQLPTLPFAINVDMTISAKIKFSLAEEGEIDLNKGFLLPKE